VSTNHHHYWSTVSLAYRSDLVRINLNHNATTYQLHEFRAYNHSTSTTSPQHMHSTCIAHAQHMHSTCIAHAQHMHSTCIAHASLLSPLQSTESTTTAMVNLYGLVGCFEIGVESTRDPHSKSQHTNTYPSTLCMYREHTHTHIDTVAFLARKQLPNSAKKRLPTSNTRNLIDMPFSLLL
jgi:hypothetical protein